MGSLAGKVALVTGGANGIGRAVVEGFLEAGARVAVLDRDVDASKQLASDLGSDAHVTIGSVETLADNRTAVAEAVDRFGRLDIFVGNAGVGAGNLPLSQIPLDRLEAAVDEIYAINVKGYLLGAVPHYPNCYAPAATSSSRVRSRATALSTTARCTCPPSMRTWASCADWRGSSRRTCVSTAWQSVLPARGWKVWHISISNRSTRSCLEPKKSYHSASSRSPRTTPLRSLTWHRMPPRL